uniref:Sperm microtubule inner protein 2 n=2 Tax=Mus TaxID=862507 RepID=A0A8C6N281_MUSSI
MALSHREPHCETVGKRMIVTGPDYVKDHLPKVHQHTAYIGEKRPALEKTGDLRYLWRPASNRSLPAKYKHEYTCGIGWGIPQYSFFNRSRVESGFHIQHGELSLRAMDKITHRYQNPCKQEHGPWGSSWMLVTNSAGRKISDPDKDLGGSPDLGHQQVLRGPIRPLTSVLPQAAAPPEDINKASGGSADHGPPPGLQLLTSPPDINTDSGRTTDPDRAPSSSPGVDYVSSGDSTDISSDWYGLQRLCRPLTSIWPPPAARPRDSCMISGHPHGLPLFTCSTDSDYSRTTDPDLVLSSCTVPNINMVSRGHRGYSDRYGPQRLRRPLTSIWPPAIARPKNINMDSSSSLEHGHPHGLQLLTSPKDINTDSGCNRTTDPDMALSSSMSPDTNMISGGGRGYTEWHGHLKLRSPQTPMWPQVAPQPTDVCMTSGSNTHLTKDINKDPRFSTMQCRADGAMDNTVASDGSPAQGYQPGFRLKYRLRRSAWS